jgi:hypothetical protein
MSSPVIQEGRLLCYRVFDAANEIRLGEAEKRISGAKGRRRVRIGREEAFEVVVFKERPLQIDLGKRMVKIPSLERELEATLVARIFEYGAISILFDFPIDAGASFASLTPLCAELYDEPVLDELGRAEMADLLAQLGDAAEAPRIWHGAETYTVIFVQKLQDGTLVDGLRASPEVAKLLIGEKNPKPLHRDEVEDVLEGALSYFEDDLVIIDWNSALVIEPSGARDIPDILEFATSQLLEHRYYDSLLDAELERIYDETAKASRRLMIPLGSPYGALARAVLRRLVELWEFTERVENALKIIGDFYTARVYLAAVKRFRIPAWQASLNEKQSLVRQAYDLLKGDVDIQRATMLEVIIILLILFEVVQAFWRR